MIVIFFSRGKLKNAMQGTAGTHSIGQKYEKAQIKFLEHFCSILEPIDPISVIGLSDANCCSFALRFIASAPK